MGENDIKAEDPAMAEDLAKVEENMKKDENPGMQEPDRQNVPEEEAGEEETEETFAEEEPEETGEEEPEDGQEDEGKEKRKVFGKSKRKDKKDEALKEKIAELEDKVVRQMAEFENFRKRTEKEKSAMFETGARSVIEKILPVVDNFERGLAAIPEAEKGNPFADGMNMIYKQLMTELENIGVKPIEAVGCEFDPNYHNAVMQVESEGMESGMVAQELQKGYMYRDTVVRHSMVGVTP